MKIAAIDAIERLMDTPLGMIWALGGVITYISLVIDAWRLPVAISAKLLINLTADLFFAAVWPVVWLEWILAGLAHPHFPT